MRNFKCSEDICQMGEGDSSGNIVMSCPSRCFECWHVDRWDSSAVPHVSTCSDLIASTMTKLPLLGTTSFLVLVLVRINCPSGLWRSLEYEQYWKTIITLKSLLKIKRYKVKAMGGGTIKRYWQVTCSIYKRVKGKALVRTVQVVSVDASKLNMYHFMVKWVSLDTFFKTRRDEGYHVMGARYKVVM